MAPNQPLRVLLLSAVGTQVNPYIGLLRDGLAAAGAEVRLAGELDLAAFGPGCRPDVIHLHWLDRYDLPRGILLRRLHAAADLPRRALRRLGQSALNAAALYQVRRWLRLRRLLNALQRFRSEGGCVAYTVHNLDPHEEGGPADRWGMQRLLGMADVVHVHDPGTADALADRFGRRSGITVAPHGHYLAAYPNTVSREEARSRLALPAAAFVYTCLGLLRPYKGLEELIPAFRGRADVDARLVLAGRPEEPGYAHVLQELAQGDARIRLEPRFVPADEVQLFLNAADVCVLPYRQITTSGAALLAFSFGLPVIAPAIGAFPALVSGRRGILYDPAAPEGLPGALELARNTDWEGARAEIVGWVARFDWAEIGGQLLAAYVGSYANR